MVIPVLDAARDFGDGGRQLIRRTDLERSVPGWEARRIWGDGGRQLIRRNDLERSIAGRAVGDERASRSRADDSQRRRRRMRAAFGAAGNMNLERAIEMR